MAWNGRPLENKEQACLSPGPVLEKLKEQQDSHLDFS